MLISLIGFMGTGKSIIGRKLADKINYEFEDSDYLIKKDTDMSIPDIFAEKGEDYFRRKEKEMLKKFISNQNNCVLATGGGIVLDEENRILLKSKSFTILLTAEAKTIYWRIKKDGDKRPLLEVKDPQKRINELLKKREKYYREFHPVIKTDNKNPEIIVKEILKLLKNISGRNFLNENGNKN